MADHTPSVFSIPAAAWSRGLGVPYSGAVRARVTNQPMIDDGPWGGVPLGGIGAGSIGRTHRGDFARWHLDIGAHRFESLPANTFAIYTARPGAAGEAHVLSPLRPPVLTAWNWDLPQGAGTYHALFPKAWFVYDWDRLPVRLAQKQFSPILPGNYRETSYPVGLFAWQVENPTSEPLEVGLLFSWQNLVGHAWGRDLQGGNCNQAIRRDGLAGLVFTRAGGPVQDEWDGSFAILAAEQPDVRLSYHARFALDDGQAVWADFARSGRLGDVADDTPAAPGEAVAGALCASLVLASGEARTVTFALAWDFPLTEFGAGTRWYKRYTRFYGRTGRRAWDIAADALANAGAWEAAIDAWQSPILADAARPLWYKTALLNELYFLVDGGALWEDGRADLPEAASASADSVGHFAFLECYDYPFYNTFDVNFYSSFALLLLWPELETSIIRDFIAAVPVDDPEPVIIQYNGARAVRKVAGAVPHDLGGPPEDPLLRLNFFRWQDINKWKDLNSKFVLQLWRDYVATGDVALVHEGWPAVVQALDYLHCFDRDGDGLPDHDNVPDQTYDTWSMAGASAYGGGLWLAALQAGVRLAQTVGASSQANQYARWLALASGSFESRLWTGAYYRYDSSGGPHSDSIMADQLAGQWYADATGLGPIVPEPHILTTLRTIYAHNVCGFAGGQMGAVNGMRPDGQVDLASEQSQEVWTGTTYALAALMLHRGLRDEAWATAWGVYNVTYNRGLWFRTPEAYDEAGRFRASMYMRPLSIWAMEHALRQNLPNNRP